jgi:sensor histidine kinase YesM
MVNERILQLIFIPLLGLTLSVYLFLSELRELNLEQGLVYFASFILLSHLGILSASSNIQRSRTRSTRITIKTILLNALTCGLITAFGIFIWQLATSGQPKIIPILLCSGISMVLTTIFTLVHEIIFLRNEKIVNDKVVQHLDKELLDAEVNLLKNELDPHFVYNTLMPLYYLVKTQTGH